MCPGSLIVVIGIMTGMMVLGVLITRFPCLLVVLAIVAAKRTLFRMVRIEMTVEAISLAADLPMGNFDSAVTDLPLGKLDRFL